MPKKLAPHMPIEYSVLLSNIVSNSTYCYYVIFLIVHWFANLTVKAFSPTFLIGAYQKKNFLNRVFVRLQRCVHLCLVAVEILVMVPSLL